MTNGSDRHNDLNVTWTAVVCFVGGILIFAFIVAVQIIFYQTDQAQFDQKVVTQAPEQLNQLRSDQLARINSYRLVDEKRDLAAIPIDQAMDAFARDPAAAMRAIRAAAATQPAADTAPAGQATQPQPGGAQS